MQLAVNQFYKYQPASKWAFDVQFSNPMLVYKTKTAGGTTYSLKSSDTFTQKDLERISQSVVSITQPKYDIKPYTKTYGNFNFVIPMYDVNNIRMTVTFEDTDDCLISYKFLTSLMGGSHGDSSIPAWLNIHETILLTITEYNTYNYDVERPNTLETQQRNWNSTSVKSYFCKMIDYTEPNYNRTSEDAHATTMTITFLAVPAYPTIVNDNLILTDGVEEVNVEQEFENVTKEIKELFKTIGYAIGFKDEGLVHTYAEKAKNWIKTRYGDTRVTVSRLQEWIINDKDVELYSRGSTGNCAAGVSLILSIDKYANGKGTAEYKARGHAYEYNADTTNVHKKLTVADVDKAVENLDAGQSFIVRFSKTKSHEYGHVVIVSKNSDGKLQYTSDHNQVDWKTYSNLQQLIDQEGMQLDILDYENVVK